MAFLSASRRFDMCYSSYRRLQINFIFSLLLACLFFFSFCLSKLRKCVPVNRVRFQSYKIELNYLAYLRDCFDFVLILVIFVFKKRHMRLLQPKITRKGLMSIGSIPYFNVEKERQMK